MRQAAIQMPERLRQIQEGTTPCGQELGSAEAVMQHLAAGTCENSECKRTTITKEKSTYIIKKKLEPQK